MASKDADKPRKDAGKPEVIVYRGSLRTVVYAVGANGSMPAKDFIENLDESDRRKIAVLFHRMGEAGKVPNRQQFKHVRGQIFEFKKHQVRVFCFRKDDRWLLTNGYKKKSDRLDQKEIARAERIMTEHLDREGPERKGWRK